MFESQTWSSHSHSPRLQPAINTKGRHNQILAGIKRIETYLLTLKLESQFDFQSTDIEYCNILISSAYIFQIPTDVTSFAKDVTCSLNLWHNRHINIDTIINISMKMCPLILKISQQPPSSIQPSRTAATMRCSTHYFSSCIYEHCFIPYLYHSHICTLHDIWYLYQSMFIL